jgi:hypothetical protein
LRIKTKQRGANGVINFEVLRDRAEVYQSTAPGTSSPAAAQTIDVPGPAEVFLIDSPILADANDDTGFYFVLDGQGAGFRGADVVRSIDSGATYGEVAPVGRSSVIGVAGHLGDGVTEVIDNLNTVRVVLDDPSDELTSCTLEAMLGGANACWIGGDDGEDGEILQFMTATMIGAGVYDLSGLLRGRLGTEYAVGVHSTGDRFVLLDQNATYRADYGPADWNKLRTYKAVPLLTLEADAASHDFTNTGEGKRPLSPVHITSTIAAGDATVTWIRRSRLRQPGLGNGPVPLGESVEAYEVADAGSGDMVAIAVYQLSDVRGRGRPGFAEI